MNKIESITNIGIKARGQKELISHLTGRKISLKASVLAKCYECMGYYADGRTDCEGSDCPLYPYNPAGAAWKNRERKGMTSTALEVSKKALADYRNAKQVSRQGEQS